MATRIRNEDITDQDRISYDDPPTTQWVYDGSTFLLYQQVDGTLAGPAQVLNVVTSSLSDAVASDPVTVVPEMQSGDTLQEVMTTAQDEWHRKHGKIFRYFFRYPSAQRPLVHAFCAAVRDDWSSTVRDGGVPSAWNEQQVDSGEYLLQYDAKMGHAVQYGREEPIAQQAPDFDKVDFAKTMSPAIDWGGMELTDPRDGTKKTFAPGDLHLTDDESLQDQIHTQVTRVDLVSHWGLSFS